MGLRGRKQTYVHLVKTYFKTGQLTSEEAKGFEEMFRRCRSQEEQHQVFEALLANVTHLNVGNDVYAKLHRDDLLDTD